VIAGELPSILENFSKDGIVFSNVSGGYLSETLVELVKVVTLEDAEIVTFEEVTVTLGDFVDVAVVTSEEVTVTAVTLGDLAECRTVTLHKLLVVTAVILGERVAVVKVVTLVGVVIDLSEVKCEELTFATLDNIVTGNWVTFKSV